jgi:rubrerythrin
MAEEREVTFSTVPEIRTVEDLFAIAAAMEKEAGRRYGELAAAMARAGNAPLADLFDRLGREEEGHADGLDQWAGRERVRPSADLNFSWDLPETASEDEFAEAGGRYLASPWRVLAMAVRNEERAFAFYINVAARTADARVRAYAEAMAREELNHVARLRLERRRAWRREHGPEERNESADAPADLAGLERFIAAAALDAATRRRVCARALRAAGDAETAALLAALADEAEASVAATGEKPNADAVAAATPGRPARDLLREEARHTEAIYDALMAAADGARDERTVACAHSAAEQALSALARLRDRLAATEGAQP